MHTRLLEREEWKRGPGGHWLRYEASNGTNELKGYGQTAAEAIRDLTKKLSPDDKSVI